MDEMQNQKSTKQKQHVPGTGASVDYFCSAEILTSITTTSQWGSKWMSCTCAVLQQSAWYRAHEVNSGEICGSKWLEIPMDLAGDAGEHWTAADAGAVGCHRKTNALVPTSPQPAVIFPVEKEVKIRLLGSAMHLCVCTYRL